MSKFSVKKPFTVFVLVIAILVLGVVSYTKMTPDLLPNMDFPYILVVTAYPGTAMMRPVAVVCIGGLLYAMLMTLFVVPCIYDLLCKKEPRSVRKEDLELLDI